MPIGGLYATYHLLGEPFQQPLKFIGAHPASVSAWHLLCIHFFKDALCFPSPRWAPADPGGPDGPLCAEEDGLRDPRSGSKQPKEGEQGCLQAIEFFGWHNSVAARSVVFGHILDSLPMPAGGFGPGPYGVMEQGLLRFSAGPQTRQRGFFLIFTPTRGDDPIWCIFFN